MRQKYKFLAYILLVCILAVTLLFGASIVSKMVRADVPLVPAETLPAVAEAAPPSRTPAMRCGTYVFMEKDLFQLGFIKLGEGLVIAQHDRWVLFQQVEGIKSQAPMWVILVYVNQAYQGLPPGSACEIVAGRSWIRAD